MEAPESIRAARFDRLSAGLGDPCVLSVDSQRRSFLGGAFIDMDRPVAAANAIAKRNRAEDENQ